MRQRWKNECVSLLSRCWLTRYSRDWCFMNFVHWLYIFLWLVLFPLISYWHNKHSYLSLHIPKFAHNYVMTETSTKLIIWDKKEWLKIVQATKCSGFKLVCVWDRVLTNFYLTLIFVFEFKRNAPSNPFLIIGSRKELKMWSVSIISVSSSYKYSFQIS